MTDFNFAVKNDEGKVELLVGDDDELVADLNIEDSEGKRIHSMFVNESELHGLAVNARFMADYLTAKRQKQQREENK